MEVTIEWFNKLSAALTLDFERAIKQRDEFLRTGIVTASHGGSHDTCTDHLLRTHLKEIGVDVVEKLQMHVVNYNVDKQRYEDQVGRVVCLSKDYPHSLRDMGAVVTYQADDKTLYFRIGFETHLLISIERNEAGVHKQIFSTTFTSESEIGKLTMPVTLPI